MPGAGKDEFISVARRYGFKDFHMGETVKRYASMSSIRVTDSDIGGFATSQRKENGMDIWARRTYESIAGSERIVIDGMRNQEELEYFKTVEKKLFVVAIYANRTTRLERILKRNRPDDIRTLQELVERDNRELSWGIARSIVLADYLIVNDRSLQEFQDVSSDLLTAITGSSDAP